MLKPDFCTSLNGCIPPNKHCRDCSHAVWFGEVEVIGKKHLFQFNPQYGVTFVTKSGEPRVRQPSEKNPVWEAWGKWHDEFF